MRAIRYLVCTIWMDSDSERRRMVNPRKAYTVDSELMVLYNRSEKANIGHALETMVLVELQRRHADVTNFETADREFRFLIEAAPEYPTATRHILTLNRPSLLPPIPEGSLVQTAYDWVLKKDTAPPGVLCKLKFPENATRYSLISPREIPGKDQGQLRRCSPRIQNPLSKD